MNKILYVKFDKNISTCNRTVTLGEVGELQCVERAIVNRLKTEKLYTFQNVRKGKHPCAARKIFSILDVVEKVQEIYPELEIQNLGETDFIVEYSTRPVEPPAFTLFKVSFVCLVCFFGAIFSIMAFNADVSTTDLFGQLYVQVTGQESDGFTILELTYSLGLAVGIIGFFNHIGGRRLSKEPTPIEVEMRLYEEDVNTTLINTANRENGKKKMSEKR